jgi:hypothetical protein
MQRTNISSVVDGAPPRWFWSYERKQRRMQVLLAFPLPHSVIILDRCWLWRVIYSLTTVTGKEWVKINFLFGGAKYVLVSRMYQIGFNKPTLGRQFLVRAMWFVLCIRCLIMLALILARPRTPGKFVICNTSCIFLWMWPMLETTSLSSAVG